MKRKQEKEMNTSGEVGTKPSGQATESLVSQERWVLRETLASRRLKTPIYFMGVTAIGPMSTPNLEQAQRFNSKQEAMMSPAYVDPLSFYEPELEPDSWRE